MTKTQDKSERAESIRTLKKLLKPGDTVFTVLRHRSSSGMSRDIDFFIIRKGEPYWLSYHVGKVLGLKRSKGRDGLKVGGCGMDMGFHVVYELSRALFPKGFVPAKAGRGGRNGSDPNEIDTDGGYALNQRWL